MASGTSYNGWPANSDKNAIDIQPFGDAVGLPFPGGVKGGDVTTVLKYVAYQFHLRVEPVIEGWDWGYTYKANVNSPSQLSCHASGTALDINAPSHPNGSSGTFTDEQEGEIYAILDEVQGAVDWLHGYDEMHFEICVGASTLANVAALLGDAAPPKDWFDTVEKSEMQEMLDAALAPIKSQLTAVQGSADKAEWGINSDAGTRVMIAANTDLTNRALAAADTANWGVNDADQGTRRMIADLSGKVDELQDPPKAPVAAATKVVPPPAA